MEKLKIYREYCYDLDYNFYHNTGKELISITRKEYRKKTGESDYIIKKLHDSRYPYQLNDYFFVKSEDGIDVPVDYLLYDLVSHFNKIGFTTNYVHQGKVYHIGFNYSEDIMYFFEKNLGPESITVIYIEHDFRKDGTFNISKYWDEARYSGKFIIVKRININFDGSKERTMDLYFDNFLLNLAYKKFGVKKIPNSELKEKAHKGGRIIRPIHVKDMEGLIRA